MSEERVALAKRVLVQVTEEFREWTRQEAKRTLEGLVSLNPAPPDEETRPAALEPSVTELAEAFSRKITLPTSEPQTSTGTQVGTSKATVWTADNTSSEQTEFPIYDCEEIDPVPEYESWVPLKGKLFRAEPSFDDLCYIPYGDDPTFPAQAYEDFYFDGMPTRDPELEVIELETSIRLIRSHNFAPDEIDETEILELPVRDVRGGEDLASLPTSRDFPDWPGLSRDYFPTLISFTKNEFFRHHLQDRVGNLFPYFCPIVSCAQYLCTQHPSIFPPFKPREDLLGCPARHKALTTCESDCVNGFNSIGGAPIPDSTWTEQTKKDMKDILSLAPDATSCDLATMLEKPCNEVYYWLVAFGYTRIEQPRKKRRVPHRRRYADLSDPQTFFYLDPCGHEGDCTSNTKCMCFVQQMHCLRGCSCSKDCERRFKGCSCLASSNGRADICRTNRCPCFKLNRECIPELCLGCKAGSSEKGNCNNCPLQLRIRKKIIVKPSEYGWGAFIGEDISEGEFISEYIGEEITEDTATLRSLVSNHTKRNYRFEMNKRFTMDASAEGNETRFINHSTSRANIKAIIRIYDGDHAVALYAARDLTAGEEIFLNYGEDYFHDHDAPAASFHGGTEVPQRGKSKAK